MPGTNSLSTIGNVTSSQSVQQASDEISSVIRKNPTGKLNTISSITATGPLEIPNVTSLISTSVLDKTKVDSTSSIPTGKTTIQTKSEFSSDGMSVKIKVGETQLQHTSQLDDDVSLTHSAHAKSLTAHSTLDENGLSIEAQLGEIEVSTTLDTGHLNIKAMAQAQGPSATIMASKDGVGIGASLCSVSTGINCNGMGNLGIGIGLGGGIGITDDTLTVKLLVEVDIPIKPAVIACKAIGNFFSSLF